MKILFYILTILPIGLIKLLFVAYSYLGLHKRSRAFKVTKKNLEIAYPELDSIQIMRLSTSSIIETLLSGYESFQSWSRPIHISGKKIYRIENNYLLSRNIVNRQGLIVIAIHNRSVDMLLKFINSKTSTTTLYKQIKNKKLDSFVRSQREDNESKTYETSIAGVRQIYKALMLNKVICLAADQVPQDGMGEYIKLFNRDAYTTTLATSLAIKTSKPVIYICMNSFSNNMLGVTIKACSKDIYDDSKHKLSMNKDIENLININPKDYSWEYKRFKKPQTGIDNPYLSI